jgi:hypothetical protein
MKQKIMVVRQSGEPVELDRLEEFKKEWKEGYDAIYDEKDKNRQKDMSHVQDEIEAFSKKMNEKYDTIIDLDLPTDMDQWKAFVEKWGSVLLSTHKDTGKPMLVIMDQGL